MRRDALTAEQTQTRLARIRESAGEGWLRLGPIHGSDPGIPYRWVKARGYLFPQIVAAPES